MDPDLQVYFIDGSTCTLVFLNCGKFFQLHAPSTNPLFSIEETGFMHSACGLLCYYGESDLTHTIDLMLQIPLPDEDLITSLLCWDGLDAEFAPSKTRYNSNKSTYCLAPHLKIRQDAFSWKYGNAGMVPPPYLS